VLSNIIDLSDLFCGTKQNIALYFLVYKRIFRKGKTGNSFIFQSDNQAYQPFEVKAQDILEIWEYACSFCVNEYAPTDLGIYDIQEMFASLQRDVKEIKAKIDFMMDKR
jgi:hypothetical protein